MYFLISEFSRARLSIRNMFHHLTWLFSDSEFARELDPYMVPKSCDPYYKENRSSCGNIILERQKQELDITSAAISIQILFNWTICSFIYSYYITLASALACDLQSVAGGVKRDSTDGGTEAAIKKPCLAVDKQDIKPDIEWIGYDVYWNCFY